MATDLSGPPSNDDLRIVGFEDHEATSRRLTELETQIQRNVSAIGLALREIRDRRLYRETHPTFESYLEKRWGYSRSHGYRLINHAIEAQMSPGGDKPEFERETRRRRSERKKCQELKLGPEAETPDIAKPRDPLLAEKLPDNTGLGSAQVSPGQKTESESNHVSAAIHPDEMPEIDDEISEIYPFTLDVAEVKTCEQRLKALNLIQTYFLQVSTAENGHGLLIICDSDD